MDIWASWGVLGCPRVSWGIKTDRLELFPLVKRKKKHFF